MPQVQLLFARLPHPYYGSQKLLPCHQDILLFLLLGDQETSSCEIQQAQSQVHGLHDPCAPELGGHDHLLGVLPLKTGW